MRKLTAYLCTVSVDGTTEGDCSIIKHISRDRALALAGSIYDRRYPKRMKTIELVEMKEVPSIEISENDCRKKTTATTCGGVQGNRG